ncbi:serine hydrolase domain-containing protein [Diplocloster agilis]|uniref:serine hydrolase domain-containing protein n=1 Tax=Diplocloster agilis TaxID=2850323 RepID=UPI000821EEDE|nr:serine hydrolase domain-containing protein [Suonthocola fibrivorans]MCU6735726.1 beta-lactamase family protein [Suonthocola fibrivorans]SCJ80482.1 Esterase estB [uncultured Clostridium sp.]
MTGRNFLVTAEAGIHRIVQEEMKKQQFTGASIRILHKGVPIFCGNYGYADREAGSVVRDDTIFRLYSLSKPIAAAAAYIQIERGLLDLEDPVARYLPAFAKMQVYTVKGLVPAKRPILVRELLSMTSGLVYPDPDPAGEYMREVFTRAGIRSQNGNSMTTAEVIDAIAEKPLAFQPGEQWRYGTGTDVMGRIIEVTAGMRLGEFYRNEIFEPLGMKDTGFYVPKEKTDRLAQLYSVEENEDHSQRLVIERERTLGLTDCLSPPAYESAGAGLLSTIRDYAKFAVMLSGNKERKGTEILGRKTLELMLRPQLTKEQEKTIYFEHLKGYSYGNFMRFYKEANETASSGSPGEFGWDGWTGPYMAVNREEDFVLLFMTQRCGYCNPAFIRKLRNIAYALL